MSSAAASPEEAGSLGSPSKPVKTQTKRRHSEVSGDEDYLPPGRAAKRKKSQPAASLSGSVKGRGSKAKPKKLTKAQQKEVQIQEFRDAVARSEEQRREREGEMLEEMAMREKKMSWKEKQKIHLFDLPSELLDEIFCLDKGYSIKDYISISGTCWTLRSPFQNDELWRAIYKERRSPLVSYGPGPLDEYPQSILDIKLMHHGSTSGAITPSTYYTYRETYKAEDYRYTQFHIDPPLPRPKIESQGDLAIKLLDLYNKNQRRAFDWRQYDEAGKYVKNEKVIKSMPKAVRSSFLKTMEWHISQLPISKAELKKIKTTSGAALMAKQLQMRIWTYEPWHMLCLRTVHFAKITVPSAIRYRWLHPEDLPPRKAKPLDSYSTYSDLANACPMIAVWQVDDLTHKLASIIVDRKSRRQPAIAARAASVPRWHKKTPSRSINCYSCQMKHDVDHAGCLAWFHHPDHPDHTGADAGTAKKKTKEDEESEGEGDVAMGLERKEDSDSDLSDCPDE